MEVSVIRKTLCSEAGPLSLWYFALWWNSLSSIWMIMPCPPSWVGFWIISDEQTFLRNWKCCMVDFAVLGRVSATSLLLMSWLHRWKGWTYLSRVACFYWSSSLHVVSDVTLTPHLDLTQCQAYPSLSCFLCTRTIFIEQVGRLLFLVRSPTLIK